MPDRQRVLWLIKGLARGGAERLVSVMAPRIDRTRFEVEVAYLLPDADAFVPDLLRGGVRVHCLQAGRNVEPGWPARLRQLLRDGRYDIVHSHSPLVGSVARLVAPRGTRHLYTEHNMWGVYRGPTFALNALTYHRNELVFTVSDGVADSVQRPRWANISRMPPVEVLLHGVDAANAPRGSAARGRARELMGIAPETPVIGNVANFSPKKDHHTLLDAFAQVREAVPEALLLLIGMGPLEAELRTRVASEGLEDSVRFLGSRDDVQELLPALDLFVLSSRFEGLPISLLEAMAAEVCCVSTSVGGIPEALRDGKEGALVAPGSHERLAAMLATLLNDPGKMDALASAGRQRVEQGFSIGRAVRTTEAGYVRVSSTAPADPGF